MLDRQKEIFRHTRIRHNCTTLSLYLLNTLFQDKVSGTVSRPAVSDRITVFFESILAFHLELEGISQRFLLQKKHRIFRLVSCIFFIISKG